MRIGAKVQCISDVFEAGSPAMIIVERRFGVIMRPIRKEEILTVREIVPTNGEITLLFEEFISWKYKGVEVGYNVIQFREIIFPDNLEAEIEEALHAPLPEPHIQPHYIQLTGRRHRGNQ